MMIKFLLLSINISIFCGFLMVLANVEFSNIKCVPLEDTIVEFYDCRIVAVNRSYKYLTVKLHLKQPVMTAKVNIAAMKRLNGYKPFLYNFTYDLCSVSRGSNKNPLVKFYHGFFTEFVNLNHPCPFDHDIIFDKVSNQHINKKLTLELPFPPGDHALYTLWTLNGKKHVDVRVYVKLT